MLAQVDLDELLKVLRAAGVTRYRNGDLEIELAPVYAPTAEQPGEDDADLTPEQRHEKNLETLLRSSGSAVPARLKIQRDNAKAAE